MHRVHGAAELGGQHEVAAPPKPSCVTSTSVGPRRRRASGSMRFAPSCRGMAAACFWPRVGRGRVVCLIRHSPDNEQLGRLKLGGTCGPTPCLGSWRGNRLDQTRIVLPPRREGAANPWLGAIARCSRTGSSNLSPSSGESHTDFAVDGLDRPEWLHREESGLSEALAGSTNVEGCRCSRLPPLGQGVPASVLGSRI